MKPITVLDWRTRREMTALELSRATGGKVSEMRIYALERGRGPASRAEAEALAHALGVKVEQLGLRVRQ